MTKLYIEDDAGNVRVVPIEREDLTLGRAGDNDIVLPERNVSRHHARLRFGSGRIRVSETGSRFGTKVNGARLEGEQEIQPGDFLQIGDFRVKVLPRDAALVEATPRPPSPPTPTRPPIRSCWRSTGSATPETSARSAGRSVRRDSPSSGIRKARSIPTATKRSGRRWGRSSR